MPDMVWSLVREHFKRDVTFRRLHDNTILCQFLNRFLSERRQYRRRNVSNGDTANFNAFRCDTFFIDWNSRNFVDNFDPLDHVRECGELPVELELIRDTYEKLGAGALRLARQSRRYDSSLSKRKIADLRLHSEVKSTCSVFRPRTRISCFWITALN